MSSPEFSLPPAMTCASVSITITSNLPRALICLITALTSTASMKLGASPMNSMGRSCSRMPWWVQ